MRDLGRRILASVLCLAMATSLAPVSAFGEDRGQQDDQLIELVRQDSESPIDLGVDQPLTVEAQDDSLPVDTPNTSDQPPNLEVVKDDAIEVEPEGSALPSQSDSAIDEARDADRVQYHPELPKELLAQRTQTEDSALSLGLSAQDETVLTAQSVASLGYTPYKNYIWLSSAGDAIHFLTREVVSDPNGWDETVYSAYRYDLASGTVTKVYDMNEDRFYYTDDTLYAFVSKHGVYDEETYDYTVIDAQVVAVDMTDGSTNSIPLPGTDLPLTMGVDHSGRMYLLDFGGSTDGFVLNVFSPSGKLLASKTINSSIDGFLGFDATNGNFYYSGDYNWVYWGYDHAMAALKVGNFNGKSIAINDKPITIFYQKWFFDHYGCAEMLSDRYLADLSTFSGEVVSILDSHSIGVNDVTDMATSISLMDSGVSVSTVCLPSKAIALGVRTIESQYENDVDVTGVGPRATYLESSDTLAVQTQSQELSLFKLSTKKRIGTIATSAPIYKVMAASSKLVVLEKTSSGELQVETATIQMPTTIKLAGPKSVVAGGSADYTATLNGNVSLDVHLTSSKNGVLSIDDQGHASAWSAGTTVLTATTDTGLTATYKVTVSANTASKKYGGVIKTKGAVFSNWNAGSYSTYGNTVKSYLNEVRGGFVRVQARSSDVLVETLSAKGKVTATKPLAFELPVFGGYFRGADGSNYLVFGKNNLKEADTQVVVRVVKYNSAWEKLAACSIKGANTYIPFDAGSLRMDERGGKLYVHTCHEMFASEDGYNHQANMTFVIKESTMKLADSYTDVMNLGEGYVSHSFNQFVRVDGTGLYRVDHGDSGPRGIAYTVTPLGAKLSAPTMYGTLAQFKDESYYNYTGASVGGFELSDSHALVVWNEDANGSGSPRNVKITSVSKQGGEGTTVQVTNYKATSTKTCYTPQLVKVDDRHFVIMWTEYDSKTAAYTMGFARINQAGQRVGKIVRKRLPQSDCQPIALSDGNIGWFVSSGRSVKLYSIDPLALESATEDPFTQESMRGISMSTATVSTVGNKSYTGKAIAPKPTVKVGSKTLKLGTDYTLSYSNNVNVGTAWIDISGIGMYEGSTYTYFSIVPRKLSKATVELEQTSVGYNGTVQKPKVTVKIGSTAIKSSNYKVTYASGCTKLGTYAVTVQGKNNLTGTERLSFKIVKGNNPIAVKAVTRTVDGAAVKKNAVTVDAPFKFTKKAAGAVTYTKLGGDDVLSVDATTGKVTVKKGTAAGTYTIKIKASAKGTANYKAGSKAVTGKVVVS